MAYPNLTQNTNPHKKHFNYFTDILHKNG